MEYGPRYDAALHVLLWELLSKLEKLLPVPDLKQVFGPSIQMSHVPDVCKIWTIYHKLKVITTAL